MATETRKRRNYTEDSKRDAVALVTAGVQVFRGSEVPCLLLFGSSAPVCWG